MCNNLKQEMGSMLNIQEVTRVEERILWRNDDHIPPPLPSSTPPHENLLDRRFLSLELGLFSLLNMAMDGGEAQIDQLPMDLLAHIFVFITCFKDLAQTSSVCKKWREGVKQSMGRREKLNFAGWKMDDKSTSRLVCYAYALKELDISKSRWGCQITDNGLFQISTAKCIINLTSISLWGMTGITDKGVVQLISRANSLQHLNIGGTFITDESLFAISTSCPHLKSAVLWGCRHVTENGLQVLVNKCRKLESINVWGMRIPLDSFIALLAIRPALQITPQTLLNIGNAPLLPVF